MKVTWEPEDIKVGRRYSKPGITEIWIIGYIAPGGRDHPFVSCSMLDGMVTPPKDKEAFAAMLTAEGYLPIELIPQA